MISSKPDVLSMLILDCTDSGFEKNCKKLAEEYFYSSDKVIELLGKLRSAVKGFIL